VGDQDPTAVEATASDEETLQPTGDHSTPPLESQDEGAAATAQAEEEKERQPRRKQRDILRETRKELSLERQSRLRAEQQVQGLSETVQRLERQLNQLNQNFTAQQRQRMEEELSMLPPEERLEKRIEMMEARVAQALQPARPSYPQAPPADDIQARIRARAMELLQVVNADYGLVGDEMIDLTTPGLDFTTEARFVASAGKIAEQRVNATENEEDTPVPAKKTTGAVQPTAEDREALKNELKKEVMRELGISRPNSPAAAPARSGGPVTSEDFIKVAQSYDSRKGYGSVREQFKQLQRQAQEQAQEYLRSGKPVVIS
jgi:hypothetical protein